MDLGHHAILMKNSPDLLLILWLVLLFYVAKVGPKVRGPRDLRVCSDFLRIYILGLLIVVLAHLATHVSIGRFFPVWIRSHGHEMEVMAYR